MTDSKHEGVLRYAAFPDGDMCAVNVDGTETFETYVRATDYDTLTSHLATLTAEVERLSGSLAACGVIAGCDTEESFAKWRLADDNSFATDSSRAVTRMRSELTAATSREAALREALGECEDYFDNRADVKDGSYGEPAPNDEMRMLQVVRQALAGKGEKS